jgi:riboflavin kinase/FMN adenylyltransferase
VQRVQVTRRATVELQPGQPVAVGVFDGVHLGHQAVLAETTRRAVQRGGPAIAIVRESPVGGGSLLTTLEHRLELIARVGIDQCAVVADDGRWPPVVSTADVVEVAPVALSGERAPISSSAICDALIRGDVERAGAMLGRAYDVNGVVEHGDHRGRTIGFPTANLALPRQLQLPADGVYGGWYQGGNDRPHLAAINLGRRPTFYDEGVRLLEAYLLDFDGDLYGDQARVSFAIRLRDELKFDSVDELKTQMHADVDAVRRLAHLGSDPVEGAP